MQTLAEQTRQDRDQGEENRACKSQARHREIEKIRGWLSRTHTGDVAAVLMHCFRPTTRFAYCTVILRTPWVIAMTPAITKNKNIIIKTRTIGLTWLAFPPLGTNVFHACAKAAGKRATMPMVMMSEIPLPIPR